MKKHTFAMLAAATFTLAACGGGGGDSGSNSTTAGGASTASGASSPAGASSATTPSGSGSSTAGGSGAPAGNASAGSTDTGSSAAGGVAASAGSGSDGTGTSAAASGSAGDSVAASSGSTGSTAPKLACSAPSQASASGGSAALSAETPPAADGTRIYPSGSAFTLVYTTGARSSADTLAWTVSDHLSHVVAQGSVAVPAAATATTLHCVSTLAGYFAASATLSKAHGQVARRGSAPAGISTFGVLPSLAVPAVAALDQRRFGYQGLNDNGALLSKLGASWQIDDRQMSETEPNSKNQFNPLTYPTDPFYTSGDAAKDQVQRLVRLDGLPAFESPSGTANDYSNAPADETYYQNYMARVGTNTEMVRSKYFPTQSANYYQVTWEPQWQDTDAHFVAMYKAAHQGLHSTDTKAVVMGPADPFPTLTIDRLKRLAPLGLSPWLDAVATHGYYDAGTSPSHPPERLATDPDPANAANALNNEIHNLRAEMVADYKPGIPLFVTETGISYDLGSTYSANVSQNHLYAQGAVVARTHLILLGEGADKTFVFYGADYPDEVGYGTFFDFDHESGQFGASNLGPKPAAMTIAAMTRLIDGTVTLGPVKNVPAGIYAYSFQQRAGGKVVTALWQHNNAIWNTTTGFNGTSPRNYTLHVDSPGTSGTVTVYDSMGNGSPRGYYNGNLTIATTESPQYVVSANPTFSKANSTTPAGYVAR